MKIVKKLIIVAALLCSAMLLVACGGGGEATYKISVKNAAGSEDNTDIIIEFYQGSEKVAMQICDENGVAEKTLAKGKYDIKVTSTDKEQKFFYDEEAAKVTGSKTEIEITIAQMPTGEPEELFANGEDYEVYQVETGNTYIPVTAGEMNYVKFQPAEEGTYEVTIAEYDNIEVGYYGMPSFVQSENIGDMVEGKLHINVKESMISDEGGGTSIFVLGFKAEAKMDGCIISIARLSEAEYGYEDLPYDVYETTATLSKYTVPAGSTITDFDIFSTTGYKLVFNETDGYYHLNAANGPVVCVYLTEDPPAYLPCFKNILDRSGVQRYFFDENGEFVSKESYNDCLFEYIEYADDVYGLYPLTKDLEYIIKMRGEYVGWWNSESHDFIFKDTMGNPIPDLNTDIAWLFMCCYVE